MDLFHNLSYKEEFEGNTERSTAAYKKYVRMRVPD
ncbi:MAG TPA: palindromic element RPE1 domain-containing protein [Rickettsia endosymbiont of Omalisus fontisbellaquei]|nr:palindromic element RPE1 domain-containing protein [Rickettsia endosymbiont of Omalisus fontisbellaquei]